MWKHCKATDKFEVGGKYRWATSEFVVDRVGGDGTFGYTEGDHFAWRMESMIEKWEEMK